MTRKAKINIGYASIFCVQSKKHIVAKKTPEHGIESGIKDLPILLDAQQNANSKIPKSVKFENRFPSNTHCVWDFLFALFAYHCHTVNYTWKVHHCELCSNPGCVCVCVCWPDYARIPLRIVAVDWDGGVSCMVSAYSMCRSLSAYSFRRTRSPTDGEWKIQVCVCRLERIRKTGR